MQGTQEIRFLNYPMIATLFLDMCADNGAINRYRSVECAYRDADKVIANDSSIDLIKIDILLSRLEPETRELFIAGEESERMQMIRAVEGRKHVEDLFDRLFEEAV